MLKAKCLECGNYYFGWALRHPRHQTCPACGSALEITENGQRVVTGYSPFTAERYFVNLPINIPSSHDKDSHVKKA